MRKIILFSFLAITSFLNYINAQDNKLKITAGNREFTATLDNNETVEDFMAMLPLEITMSEMGGYEKYYYLPQNLPGSPSNVGTTYEGDLMIWSSNCLVLFYTTRSTSYSYIRLGRIDNTTGLREALGSGHVSIRLEMERPNRIESAQDNPEIYTVTKSGDYMEVSGNIERLSLYSVNGTVVRKSDSHTILTNGLTSGVYLLKIETKDRGVITKKVINN